MGQENETSNTAVPDRYTGKYILAPMVRIGTLPSRLLAIRYGADLVYSEEIIDHKMLKTKRIENNLLHTVDYVMTDGTIVFRTCKEEKDKVVFQMAYVKKLECDTADPYACVSPKGTADPERALKTARHVLQDVSGIDVNMGCPKDYSVKGGMGAALLTQPEQVYNILTALVNGINKPVTCKIRILPTVEETVKLAKVIESTGVAAVAVHGREKHERPRQPAHNDAIRAVAEALVIPVIANGGSLDMKTYHDLNKFQQDTHCSSVMVARAAQWNLSIFRKEGLLPKSEVVKEYVKTAIDCGNSFSNTKFCVLTLLHDDRTTCLATRLTDCKDMKEMSVILDLFPHYQSWLEKRTLNTENQVKVTKRRLTDAESCEIYEMNVKFIRNDYSNAKTPKVILTEMARKQNLKPPAYETVIIKLIQYYVGVLESAKVMEDSTRTFRSIVTLDGKKYTSNEWEKSKRYAEQSAAIVCLQTLGIHDGRIRNS